MLIEDFSVCTSFCSHSRDYLPSHLQCDKHSMVRDRSTFSMDESESEFSPGWPATLEHFPLTFFPYIDYLRSVDLFVPL